MAKFTYRVVIAPNLTAVSFVAMPSARKIYLKSYQKQFLEVPLIIGLLLQYLLMWFIYRKLKKND
ncbi:hypothetical protein FEZ46_05555 [Lactococcus raffinolactis]|nr:hypothetical protein FEZ46_05555 [Lactococcus raffinolactis]